jgi:hypothetical protein
LQIGERISRRETFNINQPSSDVGMSVCKVSGEESFYGPKEKLIPENPIMKDEAFLNLHPECRQQGKKESP